METLPCLKSIIVNKKPVLQNNDGCDFADVILVPFWTEKCGR